jgi:hypothetical protein
MPPKLKMNRLYHVPWRRANKLEKQERMSVKLKEYLRNGTFYKKVYKKLELGQEISLWPLYFIKIR